MKSFKQNSRKRPKRNAPWLVPLNKLSETMEALVAIEVDPVLLLLCVPVVCHCVRTALIKCPLELGGTVYVTVCTCTACILVPDGP